MFKQIYLFLRAFKYAGLGIKEGSKQRSFFVQIFCAGLAIFLGMFFRINTQEWLALVICIGGVLSAEVMNTAIEEVCNVLREEKLISYEKLGLPKDLAAGAVLLMSITSVLVGLIIFLPKILTLLVIKL